MHSGQYPPNDEVDKPQHGQKYSQFAADVKQVQPQPYHQEAKAYEYPSRNSASSHPLTIRTFYPALSDSIESVGLDFHVFNAFD